MESRHIIKIEVKKLFGLYDYSLQISPKQDNIFILYGDNGTGKSTILRLIYHMLTSEYGRAHKTYLANVAFELFEITFDDNTVISVKRKTTSKDLKGVYTLCLKNGNNTISCIIPSEYNEENHEYSVRLNMFDEIRRLTYQQLVEKLNEFNVFYISDKRNEENIDSNYDINYKKHQQTEDPIAKEMRSLHEWIKAQALAANKKGEEGTSDIYSRILSKLGKSTTDNNKTLDDIIDEFNKLDDRAKSYIQMGFISETNYKDVFEMLSKVKDKNKEAAANILTPYLEVQNKKLDALDNLVDTLIFFNKSLNDYLYDKRVDYSVSQGFKFYRDIKGETGYSEKNNEEIDVKKLSSGERQLLRLFGMVIQKSDTCPIIIIDEPELSLNIKWQRRLLSTLSYFVRNTKAQFVIATHSFEILSSHLDNTVRIGPKDLPLENA